MPEYQFVQIKRLLPQLAGITGRQSRFLPWYFCIACPCFGWIYMNKFAYWVSYLSFKLIIKVNAWRNLSLCQRYNSIISQVEFVDDDNLICLRSCLIIKRYKKTSLYLYPLLEEKDVRSECRLFLVFLLGFVYCLVGSGV